MSDGIEKPEPLLRRLPRDSRHIDLSPDQRERLLRFAQEIAKEKGKDAQIEKLEENLYKERDSRLRERFIWVVVSILVFNAWVLFHIPTSVAVLLILPFEILLLAILAKDFDIRDVVKIWLRRFGVSLGKDKGA